MSQVEECVEEAHLAVGIRPTGNCGKLIFMLGLEGSNIFVVGNRAPFPSHPKVRTSEDYGCDAPWGV
eukprot:9145770-Pyramimonas_sp.AAC.1